MKTHDLTQGSAEWSAFRAEHFGASEAAAMLGLSKKMARNELLHLKHTGLQKEVSSFVQERVFDHGHEVEALARPIVEQIIGQDLYPVTCSRDKLSASCDGQTLDGDTAMEHKQWNEDLAHSVRNGVVPEEHMPQCQQILLVTGARRVIFVVSDGTEDHMVYTEVHPDPQWFERIASGWAQFEKDLTEYVPVVEVVTPVGKAPENLPALHIEVKGAVTASNLAHFREHAFAVIGAIKTDLNTDEDFEDAKKTVKWCADVESRLEAAKQHALSQTHTIDELFRTIDAIKEEARQKRLILGDLVKSRKDSLRLEKIEATKQQFFEHRRGLQAEITGVTLLAPLPDFGGAIKGLKTFASIQNALDTALANAKIAMDSEAKDVREKLAWLQENAAAHSALFPDLQQLIAKPTEDFRLTVTSRIEQQQRAEEVRLEAGRARIHKEEADKLAAQQQAQQAAASPAPTPVQTTASTVPPRRIVETPAANDSLTLRLGEINQRLGFTVTSDFLSTLGFQAQVEGAAKLYRESDFNLICNALIEHICAIDGGITRPVETANESV